MSIHRKLMQFFSIILIVTMLSSGLPSAASAQGPGGIERQVNAQTGKVSFIGPKNGQVLSARDALDTGVRPQDPAMALAKRFGPEFGLKDPARDLSEVKDSLSDNGRITTRYQQNYQGIQVMGGELIINTNNNGDLYSVNGEVASDLSLSTKPTITLEQARRAALQAVAKWYQKPPKDFVASEPELWIYDENLLRPSTRPAELVWRMEVTAKDSGMPLRELVLVNAQRASISLHFNQIDTAWAVNGSSGAVQDPDPTPSPTPTETSLPTETSIVSETPVPTGTPIPTETSVPTETSIPAETVEATATAVPTEEITPTQVVSTPTAPVDEVITLDGATWYVAATGSNSNSCSISTSPCLTIDGAIAKAASGDIIRVASGTYTNTTGNVVTISKGVTLSGGWNSTFNSQNGASIIDGGSVRNGILVDSPGSAVVVEYFVIQNSYTEYDSGGIYLYGANFTLKNSSVINNKARRGAGIFMIGGASLNLLNSTISGNHATSTGGGIYAVDGTITINNSTIAYNTSNGIGGGITRENATVSIRNSILARNTATTNGPDCSGSISSSDHNIIGTTAGCTITSGSGDKFNVDPLISSSLTGTLPVHTLQPTSPAINAGDNSTCLSIDQRGVSRPHGSACDMGAYEFGAEAGMFIASGSNQSADPGTAFALPLTVYLLDSSANPVSGVTITFTAPSSGASGTFANTGTRTTTAVTNSNGYATSAVFTANNQLGEYTITATGGGFSATFTVRNSAADYYVSPSGLDSNSCTLPTSPCKTINAAINKAIDGDTIYIAAGVYTHTDAINHVVYINGKSLSIYGGWNPAFTAQTGYTIVDGEKQFGGFSIWGGTGKTIALDRFHVRNGVDGGIYLSSPNLTITNSAIYNNSRIGYPLNGGGIYIHSGNLTARNVTISNNTTSGQGGGIYNYNGSYSLNNVTITHNTAGWGGGLAGRNASSVKNSILFGNKAASGPDCAGGFTGMDHTLIGDTLDCAVPAGNGNLLNVNPKLGMFIEDVGYQPLLSGSPAINAGLNCFGTADQRGVARVGACDLGAYEFDSFGSPTKIVIAQGNHQRTAPNFSFKLPLYVAILDDNGSPLSGQSVTFTSPASGASALFVANGTKSLTVATGTDGIAVAEVKANQVSGSYAITALASVGSVNFSLENLAWYVSNSGNDSNSCSSPAQTCATINSAISKAHNGDKILVATGRYTSGAAEVVSITKDVTMEGGWDTTFANQNGTSVIDGQKARMGVYVSENVNATMRRFTIQNGASYHGGGVYIDGLSLTLDVTTIKNSVAEGAGGAIYNHSGSLILKRSLIINNEAAMFGGGINTFSGALTIIDSAIVNNVTQSLGGGIHGDSPINLVNVTIANNSANNGGGVYAGSGTISLNNVTIANNTAKQVGGGISNFGNDTAAFKMQNSIVANNTSPLSPDCAASVTSQGYNLIKSISGCTVTAKSGDQFNVDPRLGALLSTLGILPILPESPAIDHGNSATCLPADQRGVARIGSCDVGAYEYTVPLAPASITVIEGDGQRTAPNFDFMVPLQVAVVDVNGSPVSGVNVTFTSPASGPSAIFSNDSRTISLNTDANGLVTTLIKANNISGSYSVIVSSAVGSKVFNLENVAWYVSPSGNNSNNCASPATACLSISEAMNRAFENDTILVASGTYKGTAEAVLSLNKDIVLSGGWNTSFTAQDGYSTIHGEDLHSGVLVGSGVTAIMKKFIVEHGRNDSIQRGAVFNDGTLTLIDFDVRYNSSAWSAAAIMNRGELTIRDSFVRYNTGGNGGGIYNQGILTVTNTAITDNSAGEGGGIYNTDFNGPGKAVLDNVLIDRNQAGNGGGIFNQATILVSNASIIRNSAESSGGGMINHGTAIISNVSIAGNTGVEGGGIQNGGRITLNNATISNNTSMFGGGLFVSQTYGSARLKNTILAGNSASSLGPDCSGTLLSSGNNILGSTSSCVMTVSNGDHVNINPQLGAFLPTEGYVPLLPTSPAVDAGNPATCLPKDQRGIPRPQGAKCDIGAYEYTVPGSLVRLEVVGGSDQLTLFNTKFRKPLQIVALDAIGSPVGGVSVSFQAPLASPSGRFAVTETNTAVVPTNSAGIAQPAWFTADNTMGTYNVIASAAGVASKSLSLHNGPWLVVPASNGGNDANDCMNLGTACASLGGVLSKSAFQESDPVWMAVGTYGSASDQVEIRIRKAVNIHGGWNTNFTEQIGTSVIQDTLQIERVSKMELQHLTVQNTGYHGIANAAPLTVKESTIRNNLTGIANSGQLIIIKSTITQNGDDVIGDGYGGVYNAGTAGSSAPDSSITILDSTITNNKGDTVGGVANYFSDTRPIRIQNSIVAGNIALYGSSYSQDCSGNFISDGYNIIGRMNVYQCEAIWQSTDKVGSYNKPVNPLLGVLQDFGNDVWVYPLKLGSPAIDAGLWKCDPLDQRGVARPQGRSCDIGAYEYEFQHNTNDLLITTYTAANTLNTAKTKICDQTDLACASGDAHAKGAHKYAVGIYNLYKNSQGRNSLDGNGIEILSSVHYGSNYQNAFWNGHMMVYGDKYGYPLADDVVAHEFTHGVTQYESNLFYYYQSGAINESFSDLWGEYYDQTNGLGTDTAAVKWLIGENVSGQGAIRSMSNPPAYQDPDKMSSSFYYEGMADSGGVHTNSGVNNKAVFLMVNGGTFNGKTVTALGWEKTAAIYYEVNTNLLSSGADYSDLSYALPQACSNLIGQKGITTNNCAQVRKAVDAVEMNGQPAPNFNTDAPLCTVAGTVPKITFADDLEAGTSKWTFSNGTYRRWQYDSPYGPYAQSGMHSLYANDDPGVVTDASARLASIVIPTNAYLHFAHAYDFETGYFTGNPTLYNFDGGVLEYKINGSSTWRDAGSLIDYNGYKGKIYTGNGNILYDNPLKGRSAFVGSSHGYISTRLNLGSLAGKTVIFRWRMGLDRGIYAWGWWVDNVKVYTCVMAKPGTFNKTAPSNGITSPSTSPTLRWGASTGATSYEYCYDTTNDNVCTNWTSNGTSTSKVLSGLSASTTYYWHVRARNRGGVTYSNGSATAFWSFTTPAPP